MSFAAGAGWRDLAEFKADRCHWGGFEQSLRCGIGDQSSLGSCPGRGRLPSGCSHSLT